MKLCEQYKKGYIVVLKENNDSLINDAEGVRKFTAPVCWKKKKTEITAWDMEGFERANLDKPVRVLWTEETTIARKRAGKEWRETTQTTTWMWVTNLPKTSLSTEDMWKGGHGRWDIENDLFNVLSTHYGLDHCFKHDPMAIVNFILTLFIAFVMLQCFHQRNLKSQLKKKLRLILIALTRKIYRALIDPDLNAPWLHLITVRPPPR